MANKWREKNIIILCAIIFTTIIIFGVLFWPTLYRYDKTINQKIVKINRITSYTEILHLNGWKAAGNVIEALPIDQNDKITIIGEFDGEGQYKPIFYNGTIWTITKIRLSIRATDDKGNQKWQRTYDTFVNIPPFTTDSSIIKLIDYATKAKGTDLSQYSVEALMGIAGFKSKEDFLMWAKQQSAKAPNERQEYFFEPLQLRPEVKVEKVFGYKSE